MGQSGRSAPVGPNPKDPLRLLEALYSFGSNEQEWLRNIIQVLAPFDLGAGVAAYVSDLGETIKVRAIASAELEMTQEAVHTMASYVPAPFYRRIHAPTPVVSNVDSFPAAAEALGMTFRMNWPVETPFPVPRAAWALAGGDANVETALITFHCDPGQEFSLRDRRTLDHVAAHLGSALRLRSVLAKAPTANDEDVVDVVFSPDGKVLEARGEAREADQRAPLLDAVLRSEQAKLRKATAEERLDVWTALVDGRWSILENVERDGKRMLLACRNEPRTSPMRRLTPRERSIVTFAALGHSLKYIAYELGVPLSTTGAALDAALRKLNISSRAELIQLFARGVASETDE